MIFVNFKTYREATGERAVELVHKLCDCEGETGVPVIPVVQAVDARACVEASNHDVWVQHTDGVEYGQFTGWILPDAIVEAGIKGTFLNHSENKKDMADLTTIVSRCREVGLKTLIFAAGIEEAVEIAKLNPDYLAYEPPELVGSRTTSVASAKAGVIKEVVEKVAPLPVIVGAGVHSKEDVEISLKQGAVGIAVATDVVLAEDPKRELLELAEGFK